MSVPIALATAERVLRQLRRDPRTVVLVLAVPALLVALFRGVLDGQPETFDRVGVPLIGILPLVSMFLVTSITMLRERTTGTLERLMTTPLGRLDLLAGYALAFGVVAVAQSAVTAGLAFGLLDLEVAGSPTLVVALAVGNALLGMALGLLVSAFASTEFQAVQFMPTMVLPQVLLCGLIVPRERMTRALELVSDLVPMSYAYDGLARVGRSGEITGDLAVDVIVVAGATLLALALGAATLRRRTA